MYSLPLLARPAGHHATFLGMHLTGDLTAGDLLVGLGTLALALLTYFSVRVARNSLEAQDAPLLIGAHVPADSPVAQQVSVPPFQHPLSFEPPFAGLLPDGYSPSFVMRLWNVGRGPAVVHDVRLKVGNREALRPMASHIIVNAGGFHDATWMSLDVPDDQRDTDLSGTLRIIYAHPNGGLLQTESRVELHERALYFRTIQRHKLRRRPKAAGPRQPD